MEIYTYKKIFSLSWWRIKISRAFLRVDAWLCARACVVLVEKTRAHRLVAAEAGRRQSVGEFAGHRSTEQCTISLPSRTTFFLFSSSSFLFFCASLVPSYNCHRALTRTPLAIVISSRHCLLCCRRRHHRIIIIFVFFFLSYVDSSNNSQWMF